MEHGVDEQQKIDNKFSTFCYYITLLYCFIVVRYVTVNKVVHLWPRHVWNAEAVWKAQGSNKI